MTEWREARHPSGREPADSCLAATATRSNPGRGPAADRRTGKGALQDRQRVAQRTAVIENREFARAYLVGQPTREFAAAQSRKKRGLLAASLGDPIFEKPLVPIVGRVDFPPLKI